MIQSMRGLNLNCFMVLEPQILKNISIVATVLKVSDWNCLKLQIK